MSGFVEALALARALSGACVGGMNFQRVARAAQREPGPRALKKATLGTDFYNPLPIRQLGVAS